MSNLDSDNNRKINSGQWRICIKAGSVKLQMSMFSDQRFYLEALHVTWSIYDRINELGIRNILKAGMVSVYQMCTQSLSRLIQTFLDYIDQLKIVLTIFLFLILNINRYFKMALSIVQILSFNLLIAVPKLARGIYNILGLE